MAELVRPLRVRPIERVRLHVDLTVLAKLACRLASERAVRVLAQLFVARAATKLTQLHRPADVLGVMRRWRLVAGLLSICLLLGVCAPADARQRGGACVPRHGTLIVADARAAVYTIRVEAYEAWMEEGRLVQQHFAERQTRGCVVGHRRSFKLWEEAPESLEVAALLGDFTLAGDMVAYSESRLSKYEPFFLGSRVLVRSLVTGRFVHIHESRNEAEKIVVKSDGSVAWIAVDSAPYAKPPTRSYEVRAIDESGERLLADSGQQPDIDGPGISSLELNGDFLSWQQGGEERHAVLR